MAQDIALLGATYPSVPAVQLPKSGGGLASFYDVGDTTAQAADVAQGKLFHSADGTLVTGTASGSGGGGAAKMGALRPDAEVAYTWSYDGMLVADLGIDIPAYSTSSTAVKTVDKLGTYTIDYDAYNWFLLVRLLTIPIYSTDVIARGRQECHFSSYAYEYVDLPASTVHAISDPSKTVTSASRVFIGQGSFVRVVYWSSETIVAFNTTNTYGIVQNLSTQPSLSGNTLTISSPSIAMRGNAAYLSQTYWEAMTDCRLQYMIELYRASKDAEVDGWEHTSQVQHIVNCLNSSNHKLT